MPLKLDIQHRADIELLIRSFYKKVLVDEQVSFIFIEVAGIDLEQHLPHLFDFWESVLLGTKSYQRNVLKTHLDLNKKTALKATHFQRWLQLFTTTVDELFDGKIAQAAKNKATSIATVIQVKLHQSNSSL